MPVDPIARGLAARANTAAGIDAAGGALSYGIHNANPTTTLFLKDMLSRSITNPTPQQFRIVFLGDSLTRGAWAGALTNNGANKSDSLYKYSAAGVFQSMLAAAGYPAIRSSWWGDGNLGLSDFKLSDPRFSLDASVALGAETSVAGFPFNITTGTATNTLTFEESFDTSNYWYLRQTGSGDFQIGANPATTYDMATFVSGNASSIQRAAFTSGSAAAIQAQSFKRNSGTVRLMGIESYDSARSNIQIANLGWVGAKASTWISNSNPYNALGSVGKLSTDPTYARQLWVINLFTNEEADPVVPPATAKANLLTLIDTIKASATCEVVLLFHYSVNATTASEPYRQVYYQIANERNLMLIDLQQRMPTQTQMIAMDWMWDGVHADRYGHQEQGVAIYSALIGLVH